MKHRCLEWHSPRSGGGECTAGAILKGRLIGFACCARRVSPLQIFRPTCRHPTIAYNDIPPTMSSLLDAVLNSDAAPTPSSDIGNEKRSQRVRSSSRPRAPPSDSAGANSDIEGFAEDEVVGARVPNRRANGPRTDVPKVVDVTGETLSLRFQEFLERYILWYLRRWKGADITIVIRRTLRLQQHCLHRVSPLQTNTTSPRFEGCGCTGFPRSMSTTHTCCDMRTESWVLPLQASTIAFCHT